MEDHWLAHLEEAHPEGIALARHLPLSWATARVRECARWASTAAGCARVETLQRDHDVRLAFPGGASTPEELREQVNGLVGRGSSAPSHP